MPLLDLKSDLANIKRPNPTPDKEEGPNFTITKNYVNNIVDPTKSPSPIEISHNETATIQFSKPTAGQREREIPGYPLATYYSQVNTNTQLGIRKSSKFKAEQPFVVRNIGDNWDNVSSNDFYDRYNTKLRDNDNVKFGSYTRLDKFLMSPAGDLFLSKQRDLMRDNAQEFRTDVRYGLTRNTNKLDENPRKYDIQSLASNTPPVADSIAKMVPFALRPIAAASVL